MGLIDWVPSGSIRSKITGLIKEFLKDFSKNPDISIENKIGEINLECHLLGDMTLSNVQVSYRVWKEKDKNEEMKRYVLHLIAFNSSKEWLNVLAKKYIVRKYFIWYRKSEYANDVYVRRGKVRWIRKFDGKEVKLRKEDCIFLPDDKFEKEYYRKALYKALKK